MNTIKIREAGLQDKFKWDTFVDNENGSFHHYFDWKYLYEIRGNHFIPLMIEMEPSLVVGVFPFVIEQKFAYLTISSTPEGASGGVLLKNDLSKLEITEIIRTLVKYVDSNYTKGCSDIYIKQRSTNSTIQDTIHGQVLNDIGYNLIIDESTGLPCVHVLELKQPFEEQIWKRLWPRILRQNINKAIKDGVIVIEDKAYDYLECFTEMLQENYKRHKNKRDIVEETKKRIEIFNDKSKLFIAFQHDQPLAGLLCHYTPSTCLVSKLGSYSRQTNNASKLCFKVAIEDACNSGYKYLDFGMSVDSGSAFFKEQFGALKIPLGAYGKTCSFTRNIIKRTCTLWYNIKLDKLYLWNTGCRVFGKWF